MIQKPMANGREHLSALEQFHISVLRTAIDLDERLHCPRAVGPRSDLSTTYKVWLWLCRLLNTPRSGAGAIAFMFCRHYLRTIDCLK
jgi:hypothetical protein